MDVKVCDYMSISRFEKDLLESARETGFAVIVNHGISDQLIKDAQTAWRKFFKRKVEYKDQFINKQDRNLGYKGLNTEKAVGAKVADIKEFYHYRKNHRLPPGSSISTKKLFTELEEIGLVCLEALSEGFDRQFDSECDGSDKTLFRSLYYPALGKVDVQKGAVRAAAHEDINHITLLVAASAPGLQVMDAKGNWHDVPHEKNSIVVNIGDMLEVASNGHYKSTTHRVINPTDSTSDRVSMPLFIHPHSDVVLKPGLTAGQFLEQRIAEIYGK